MTTPNMIGRVIDVADVGGISIVAQALANPEMSLLEDPEGEELSPSSEAPTVTTIKCCHTC